MGHYNQKTTLASLNRKMAFTKRKLRECEFDKQQLEKENAQLREALEFYADTKTYFPQEDNVCSHITMDYGAKARQALGLESGS